MGRKGLWLSAAAGLLLGGGCIPGVPETSAERQGETGEEMPRWAMEGRNMRPGPGYRFVEGLARPMAWGALGAQTPTPITKGTDHVHFADIRRKWAAWVRIPTLDGSPTRISPESRHVASYGILGGGGAISKIQEWMKVVSIESGEEVWAWETNRDVRDIRWLTEETLLYTVDPKRWSVKEPSEWVMRKLNPFTKEEREVYLAPRGCVIWNFFPSPSGRHVVVREEPQPGKGYSALYVVDLETGGKRRLWDGYGSMHPFNTYWWPDEKHVYLEDVRDNGYGPVKASVEEPGRYEPLSRRHRQLERRTKGSLSPSGRKLVYSDPNRAGVFVLDLEGGQEEEIFRYKVAEGGCWLSDVAWSKDEDVVVGRVSFAWSIPGSGWPFNTPGAAGLQYTVFAADLARREASFFRSDNRKGSPLFLVENPRVIEALRKRSVPWQ
ncbi:MAG: TolB family protein [Planctomycetota bacterium]